MAEGGPPDSETQKTEIGNLIKIPLKKGDTWYLIDTRWFKQWKKYVGYDSWDLHNVGEETYNPGPIDNSNLFQDEGCQLKEHLIDELDYVLVPTEAWNKLVSWYGMVDKQEAVCRQAIEDGMYYKQLKIEVYPWEFSLCQVSDLDTMVTQHFSRAASIDDLEKAMRKLFEIPNEKEVRLWNRYMSNTYEHLSKPDNTLQDAGLYQGQVIVIEPKNEDGTWPRQAKSTNSYNSGTSSIDRSSTRSNYNSGSYESGSSYGSSYNSSFYGGSYDPGRGNSAPGLCGLANLGNTCFMNSAIQCLSNVGNLTQYMVEDRWKNELNEDNPLGMKGEIARSYADLVRQIWSGNYSYTVPRNFKVAVGKFAPQFSGYQQQDSQELMAFLLDGLHEDLNRIHKKPYIEQKDANGRQDKEVANEAWENYQKRNDSVIVDTFHGLLKSTLVCPECAKVSVTFDPFCYLSLPLPIKKERPLEVFLVPLDPMSKTIQYKLTVPKLGNIADLCAALSKQTGISPEKMVVTDVYNHKFHKVFGMDEPLSHIMDRDDIFIYEVPVSSYQDPETLILPVYMKERKQKGGFSNHYTSPSTLFGQPLLVPVPRKECTYDKLYTLILNKMRRYVTPPEPSEEWWAEEQEAMVNGADMEVNGDDDSEETQQLDASSSSSMQTASSSTNTREQKMMQDESVDTKHRLFTLSVINSYGSAEFHRLQDDDKPLNLTNRSYIAIDWHTRAKEKFYCEKSAEDFEMHESVKQKNPQKKQVIQLDDCLKLFTTKEKLGENDPWYCPQCKKHQQATKKFDIWSLPNILVIHLKRFSYNKYWRDKIDALVEFPARGLSLKKYILNHEHSPAIYDLIAVSNHYGGMGGGHYTAYGKNKDDGEWYYYDDSTVTHSSEENVVTKAAYVLVYQKRDRSSAAPTISRPTAAAAAGAPTDAGSTNGTEGSSDEMETN
ncbi:ubiquitin carboxyl-terminal hydrolase 15-like isoform X2 [Liolophura sinensis]|uniref:ubiquitin carboxyl-terminal hydrolase 15-like isoform X2 n=1 Tax=Liolophura sinensis TaxID=3198878 RepID=UPI00315922D4